MKFFHSVKFAAIHGLVAIIGLNVSLANAGNSATKKADRPNFIIILADDLG